MAGQGGRARPAQAVPVGIPDAHRKQTDYEVGVICQMGFPAYFLVVADLVRYAKRAGIRVGPGPGQRRRDAWCPTAWASPSSTRCSYGLIFERFLNPERISMPDIDMDFDERRRGDMIRYATERYGEDQVAQIITYGTIKAKAAIKDSARVLGYPYAMGDRLTKAMPPPVMGREMSLAGMLRLLVHARYGEAAELRQPSTAEPDVANGSSRPPAASRASSGRSACTRPGSSCAAIR